MATLIGPRHTHVVKAFVVREGLHHVGVQGVHVGLSDGPFPGAAKEGAELRVGCLPHLLVEDDDVCQISCPRAARGFFGVSQSSWALRAQPRNSRGIRLRPDTLEIWGRAKRRIIRRRLREFVGPRTRVRVGLTEGGDIVSILAVGVSPLTFDDSESLVQSVKVYTVVIGLSGIGDIVKCPVLIVVIV